MARCNGFKSSPQENIKTHGETAGGHLEVLFVFLRLYPVWFTPSCLELAQCRSVTSNSLPMTVRLSSCSWAAASTNEQCIVRGQRMGRCRQYTP